MPDFPLPSSGRYALYFAPSPGSRLWRQGSAWLGRDAASGEALPPPPLNGWSPERIARMTADPARYGFHATLKPPFGLAEMAEAAALERELAAFARRQTPFTLPPLAVGPIGRFVALITTADCPPLQRLADSSVALFDSFRRPPTADELARRRQAGLSPREDELLERWGYPYVFDAWRFHMTLTGRLKPDEQDEAIRFLAPWLAPALTEPVVVDALSLFHEDRPGAPFRLIRRFPFTA